MSVKKRVLVEIREYATGEITDSYVLTNIREMYSAKNQEIQALAGVLAKDEAVKLGRAFRKFWKQNIEGMLGYGDEMHHSTILINNGTIEYFFTVLEDSGKHSRRTWQNVYAFGPEPKEVALNGEDKEWDARYYWTNVV